MSCHLARWPWSLGWVPVTAGGSVLRSQLLDLTGCVNWDVMFLDVTLLKRSRTGSVTHHGEQGQECHL